MMPVLKEVKIGADGKVKNRTFYLAGTEAFVGPCCAVPDIRGPTNQYVEVPVPTGHWPSCPQQLGHRSWPKHD